MSRVLRRPAGLKIFWTDARARGFEMLPPDIWAPAVMMPNGIGQSSSIFVDGRGCAINKDRPRRTHPVFGALCVPRALSALFIAH